MTHENLESAENKDFKTINDNTVVKKGSSTKGNFIKFCAKIEL